MNIRGNRMMVFCFIIVFLIFASVLTGISVVFFGNHWEIYLYAALLGGFGIYRLLAMLALPKPREAGHFHKDADGLLVRCFHKCKNLLSETSFWIGVTVSFPIEHYLWTKVWPFYLLSSVMGLD